MHGLSSDLHFGKSTTVKKMRSKIDKNPKTIFLETRNDEASNNLHIFTLNDPPMIQVIIKRKFGLNIIGDSGKNKYFENGIEFFKCNEFLTATQK